MTARLPLALLVIGLVSLSSPTAAQTQTTAPPIVTVSVGPWSVYFEPGETEVAEQQRFMLDAAVDAAKSRDWPLLLCYRLGRNPRVDMELMDTRLQGVAHVLKVRGVERVFRGSHMLCNTTGKRSPRPEAGIEIDTIEPLD